MQPVHGAATALLELPVRTGVTAIQVIHVTVASTAKKKVVLRQGCDELHGCDGRHGYGGCHGSDGRHGCVVVMTVRVAMVVCRHGMLSLQRVFGKARFLAEKVTNNDLSSTDEENIQKLFFVRM